VDPAAGLARICLSNYEKERKIKTSSKQLISKEAGQELKLCEKNSAIPKMHWRLKWKERSACYTVDYKGKVTEAGIIAGIGHGCDEEALRIVRSMQFKVPMMEK
jgi:hypothetical protein